MEVAFFKSFFGGNASITPEGESNQFFLVRVLIWCLEYDETTPVDVAELTNAQAGAVFGVSKIKNGNRYTQYHLASMMVVFHPSKRRASCWLTV